MVALESKTDSFGSSCRQESQGAIRGDDESRKWTDVSTTDHPIITPFFQRDALLEQRIILLGRLAECANEIKRIDEQLRLI
jgi:hypothetical protein